MSEYKSYFISNSDLIFLFSLFLKSMHGRDKNTQQMTYELEKKIWTETDFDKMGWHDSHIYTIRLTKDLELDIDYILKWNKPEQVRHFTFWLAPATLVFKNVRNVSFEFDIGFEKDFDIEGIERENQDQWTIITRQGDIQFTADGFEQFIRQEPSFQYGQVIPHIERSGFSLDRVTYQENSKFSAEVLEQRKKNLEHYENAKRRQTKRDELEDLMKSREHNDIDIKTYLIKKKEINDILFSYDYFLKGTIFENW